MTAPSEISSRGSRTGRARHLRRGMRARNSTDAVIPSRAGYPTATLASMNRYKAALQLPPHVRHARERRLPHGAPGPDAHRGGGARAGRQPLDLTSPPHASRRRTPARDVRPHRPHAARGPLPRGDVRARGSRRVAGGLPVRLPRARARVGGVLPAHARRDLPRDDDRRDLRASPRARCTRRSSRTSSTSTATITAACATW